MVELVQQGVESKNEAPVLGKGFEPEIVAFCCEH